MQRESNKIRQGLARLAAEGKDAGVIADSTISIWRGIEIALIPIVGSRGFAALYARSLYLVRAKHPCLLPSDERVPQTAKLAELRVALATQTSAEAAAASSALLQAFFDLLTGLIGDALTGQLLRSVCDAHAHDDPTAQEHST